jgi:hypothetical protein
MALTEEGFGAGVQGCTRRYFGWPITSFRLSEAAFFFAQCSALLLDEGILSGPQAQPLLTTSRHGYLFFFFFSFSMAIYRTCA